MPRAFLNPEVDALVVATAEQDGGGLIITDDPGDLRALTEPTSVAVKTTDLIDHATAGRMAGRATVNSGSSTEAALWRADCNETWIATSSGQLSGE